MTDNDNRRIRRIIQGIKHKYIIVTHTLIKDYKHSRHQFKVKEYFEFIIKYQRTYVHHRLLSIVHTNIQWYVHKYNYNYDYDTYLRYMDQKEEKGCSWSIASISSTTQ